MQKSEIIQPAALQAPFAIEGDKNIPNYEAAGTETSSIREGFLPITSEPLDENGQAPERTDFNGMFYLSTDFRVFMQNGGFITFDAAVSAKIGGYPQDAILGYINNSGQYGFVKSLKDNNTANFVTTPSKINGTDWAYVPIVNTLETIKLIYPVGSIYIGTTSTCPLAALFGTWQLVAANKALWTGNGSNANTNINASLPTLVSDGKGSHSHTGNTLNAEGSLSRVIINEEKSFTKTGVFSNTETYSVAQSDRWGFQGDGDCKSATLKINTSGKWSGSTSTVSNHTHNVTWSGHVGSTVQPPAYVVNVWRRTA